MQSFYVLLSEDMVAGWVAYMFVILKALSVAALSSAIGERKEIEIRN